MNIFIINLYVYIIMSSFYLFVFGNDRVTYHTGEDDAPSNFGDA